MNTSTSKATSTETPRQTSRDLVAAFARRSGSSLLPDNDQWTNRMEIRSETSTRLYVVSQNKKSGDWGCSCPSWKTRRTCKHLNAIVPLLTDARQPRTHRATARLGRTG